jgi:hypothetical protein
MQVARQHHTCLSLMEINRARGNGLIPKGRTAKNKAVMRTEGAMIEMPVTKSRKWWRMRSFLFASVAAHLLFGIVAWYVVVAKYSADRKLTFEPAQPRRIKRSGQ